MDVTMIMKRIYAWILSVISILFGVDDAKIFDTRLRFHRSLNLHSPKSLADKVSYIELHEQSVLAGKCTDKYAVREYVAGKGYEHILVPCAGGPWNSETEIKFEELCIPYVLKATHGCKMNYFVLNKESFHKKHCLTTIKHWLRTTYGTYSMEPHYKEIPHRVYAEKYLGDISSIIDYKIHCLNGIPEFVLVTSNRRVGKNNNMEVILDLYDMEWNPIFEITDYKSEKAGKGEIPKPKHLEEMKQIARDLSEDFKFVRVDLYEMNDQILFGELTFSPACGVFPYFTEHFLNEMGEKF